MVQALLEVGPRQAVATRFVKVSRSWIPDRRLPYAKSGWRCDFRAARVGDVRGRPPVSKRSPDLPCEPALLASVGCPSASLCIEDACAPLPHIVRGAHLGYRSIDQYGGLVQQCRAVCWIGECVDVQRRGEFLRHPAITAIAPVGSCDGISLVRTLITLADALAAPPGTEGHGHLFAVCRKRCAHRNCRPPFRVRACSATASDTYPRRFPGSSPASRRR